MLIPMERRHADEVGRLHYLYVGSFLKDLGESMCICFYRETLRSDINFGFVYVENLRVLAFTFGTMDNSKLFKNTRLRLELLIALIKRPWLINRVFHRYKDQSPPSPERCYSATDLEVRGQGVGKLMYLRMHDEFRRRGAFGYLLQIDSDNIISINANQNIVGAKVIRQFFDNGKKRYEFLVTT